MSLSPDLQRLFQDLSTEADYLLNPLSRAATNPLYVYRLLHQIGWDIDAILGVDPVTLSQDMMTLFHALEAAVNLLSGIEEEEHLETALIEAIEAVRSTAVNVRSLLDVAMGIGTSLDDNIEHYTYLATQLGQDILEHLFILYLAGRATLLIDLGRLLGLLHIKRPPLLYFHVDADRVPLEFLPGADGSPVADSDGNPRPQLPMRYPISRLGVNDTGLRQVFTIPLGIVTRNINEDAFRSPETFFLAAQQTLIELFEEIVDTVVDRDIGRLEFTLDANGIGLAAPAWLPQLEEGATPIIIPLQAEADLPHLSIGTTHWRTNWSTVEPGEGVPLLGEMLTLVEAFSGTSTLRQPGVYLTLEPDTENLESTSFSLSLSMGLRVAFTEDAQNELGIQFSLLRTAVDAPTLFTLQAEAIDVLLIPLLILDGLAFAIHRPTCQILLAIDENQSALTFELSAVGFGIQLPTLLFKRATPAVDGGGWSIDEEGTSPSIGFTLRDSQSGQSVTEVHPLVQVRLAQTGDENTALGLAIADLKVLAPHYDQVLHVNADSAIFVGFDDDPNRGFVIEVEGFDLPIPTDGSNLLDSGITISRAAVHLPPDLPGAPEQIILEQATFNSTGFSGAVSAVFENEPGDDNFLFGLIPAQIYAISLEIQDNLPVTFAIQGAIKLPDFDEWIEVQLSLNNQFDIAVQIASADPAGIVLTKEEILSLTFRSASFSYKQGLLTLGLSGALQPLLMGSDGLEWPKLDVTDLTLEQNLTALIDGRFEPPVFKFKEAWLDLKDLATLDLWGFHFELNRVGMGYEEATDKLWLDLTGSLRLIELIPVGLGVEGFRITWPRLLYEEVFAELNIDSIDEVDLHGLLQIASKIEVRFDGVYLFYGVPQTVEFEGYVRFIKEAQNIGFAGDVALRLPATGLTAEAGLLVGINFAGDPALPGIPLPYLYVYLGIELPTGIPLGQSGLAFKGALGLFGLNVAPDKTPEQNWYYDWYKREPFVGVHQTNKWRFEKWSVAFGAGITMTTTDGKIIGLRGLLALVLPGPVLVIEGRVLIFDGVLPLDPPLRALGVVDGPTRTLQLNIEAEAELVEGIVEAYAMTEAFFDFKDLTNWHFYLGQAEPRDRRIRANFLKLLNQWLFDANAYLMLDMLDSYTLRSRMGVFIGFEPPIPPLGPVQITVNATLEGEGLVTVLPEHFSGSIDLSATIGLSAFGTGFQIDAGAGVATEGANPVIVDGRVYISAEFPSPTEPVESLVSLLPEETQELVPEIEPLTIEAELQFRWESPDPPAIEAPLSLVAAESQFALLEGGGSLDLYRSNSANEQQAVESARVVPLDARPTLLFKQNMLQAEGTPFARHPDGLAHPYTVGPLAFTPSLERVHLYRKPKTPNSTWELFASSHPDSADNRDNQVEQLSGIWLGDVDMQDAYTPATRRLRLWSDQPFLNPGALNGAAYLLQSYGSNSYGKGMLSAYPNYYDDSDTKPNYICIDFADAPKGSLAETTKKGWSYQSLTLYGDPSAEVVVLTEPIRVPRPTYNRSYLWRTLNSIAPSTFSNPRTFSERQLRRWASNVSGAQRLFIRRQHRNFNTVWRWLWPPIIAQTCLLLMPGNQGQAYICFPEPIVELSIQLYEDIQISTNDLIQRRRIETFQTEPLGELQNAELVEHDLFIQGKELKILAKENAFNCLRVTRVELLIEEICYLTQAERERVKRATEQAETNDRMFSDSSQPFPILQPSYDYKLDIETHTDVELNIPTQGGNVVTDHYQEFILNSLAGFADNAGSPLRRQDRHSVYFQTQGPPHKLSTYIKWSYPEVQSPRVFRRDEFGIRFRRDYVAAMYSAGPYQLEAYLINDAGQTEPVIELIWEKAQSTTLLPEEQIWLEHAAEKLDYNPSDRPKDDVLRIKRSNASEPLAPRTRYELLITGGAGGELLFKDDFAETDAAVLTTFPNHWQRINGTLQRTASHQDSEFIVGSEQWRDVIANVDIRLQPPAQGTPETLAKILVRDALLPKVKGQKPVRQYYQLAINYDRQTESSTLELLYVVANQQWRITEKTVDIDFEHWHHFDIRAIRDRIQVWLDGTLMFKVDLSKARAVSVPSFSTGPITNISRPIRSNTNPGPFRPSLIQRRRDIFTALQRTELPQILRQGTVGLQTSLEGVAFRNFSVRDAVLYRIPFITSAFEGFNQLAKQAQLLAITSEDSVSSSFDRTLTLKYAETQLAYTRGLVDYRDELLDRETLENLKLNLREAKARIDEQFRSFADTLVPGHVYQPVGKQMELYLLRRASTEDLVGLWLKSPESLDIRLSVPDKLTSIGRTDITLTAHGNEIIPIQIIVTSDGANVIILPEDNSSWSSELSQLKLTYNRGHNDETSGQNHRYDCPVIYPDKDDSFSINF